MWVLLLVGYFALAATCTALGDPRPAALVLALVLVAALLRSVIVGHAGSAVFVGANLALVVTVLATVGAHAALSLTLVVAQATVSALFFRSLRAGHVDLVTQIAVGIHAERSRRVLAYTRAVSWCWAWFMAALAAGSLVLTLRAPPHLWWWWNNVGAAALPAGFFVAEWVLRQFILRREEKTGIVPALRALARLDYQRMFQV